jgi:hypothetical protein
MKEEKNTMLINYFDCKFENCDERNFGTNEDPDCNWVYGCTHPKGNKYCDLSNKYANEKDDCKLLDEA